MFKNLTNIANIMRTASQMGERMNELKNDMEGRRVYGRAGEGDHSVFVELNGLGVVQTIDISESLLDRSMKQNVQDLTAAAMNEAVAEAKKMHVEAVRQLTGGIELPGLDNVLNELGR